MTNQQQDTVVVHPLGFSTWEVFPSHCTSDLAVSLASQKCRWFVAVLSIKYSKKQHAIIDNDMLHLWENPSTQAIQAIQAILNVSLTYFIDSKHISAVVDQQLNQINISWLTCKVSSRVPILTTLRYSSATQSEIFSHIPYRESQCCVLCLPHFPTVISQRCDCLPCKPCAEESCHPAMHTIHTISRWNICRKSQKSTILFHVHHSVQKSTGASWNYFYRPSLTPAIFSRCPNCQIQMPNARRDCRPTNNVTHVISAS